MFDLNIPLSLVKIRENLDIGELGDKVRNKVIFENEDFIIMLVMGPNRRIDYHLNSKEVYFAIFQILICLQEFFYQIKGQLHLAIFRDSRFETIEINEGCCYVLAGGTPHKPVREENSIGLVIESSRRECENGTLKVSILNLSDS